MRLLWRETGFELVGAFCVAGFAFGAAWILMENLFGLSAVVAGLLAAATSGWALEMVSRRHYADRLPSSPGRQAARGGRTAADRPSPAAPSTERRRGTATAAGRDAGSTRRAA